MRVSITDPHFYTLYKIRRFVNMIAIIVAYADERVIGYKGKIPWNIDGEKSRFRKLTTGNVVIMGRRTYEEIGHPLPDRTTIVVSNTNKYTDEGLITAHSLNEAIDMAGDNDIYISGGARLYEEALPIADKLYITRIEGKFKGDTFFPEINEDLYDISIDELVNGEIQYAYLTYTRSC